MKEAIDPPSLHPPPGYSHVVRVEGGTIVHIAGQVAWDPEGRLVGAGDFEAQARQVFTNLGLALESVGAGFADLVRIRIYVVGHDDDKLAALRRVRDEFFADITPPASTLLGVERLATADLLVEVDAVAVID